MGNKQPKFNIVDVQSGELINVMYQGDRIRREEQDKFAGNNTLLNPKEEFIKIFVKPLLKLSTMLTNPEGWFVTYLLKYLNYTSGILKNDNGDCITIDDIMDECGLKPSYTYKILKSLEDKGIIARCKTEGQSYIAMNPYIFMKGRYASNTLIDLFKTTKWVSIFKED
ncbi:MAG: replication/maintenance protein RepL [Clostridium sp.]|uniref:winged helix-turn-helix domain-containing protein n=1 Tax=Clostridium sp. TaxID=1506 RepID=UPI0025B9048D|nr:winged helix-turn-helix domain-containing protein [Clostridium sp.]MCE5220106.1 replication/maintenance protein RepL [Clostridium sp.]